MLKFETNPMWKRQADGKGIAGRCLEVVENLGSFCINLVSSDSVLIYRATVCYSLSKSRWGII